MPPVPNDPSVPPEGRLARAARADWAGQLLKLALVLGLGASAGWLLAPSSIQRLPTPDQQGSPAAATLKADRDYDIIDEDATARRRLEAAQAVRPVYDHEEGAAEEAAARVHAAFDLMRDEGRAFRETEGDVPRDLRASLELERRFLAQKDAFVSRLQVLVRDEDLGALARARFDDALERELSLLAQRGLSGLVVEDTKLLPSGGADAGFAVRTFRAGALMGERVVIDRALVRDVATAREEVARAAAARLEKEPAALRAALARVANAMVRPTLVHDQAETERRRSEAAAEVKPVVVPVKRGEKIIGDGERIEKRHVVVFEGIRAQRRGEDLGRVRLGGGALVALLALLLWRFARKNLVRFRPARRDGLLLAAMAIATLALAFVGFAVADALHERFPELPRAALHWMIPFAAGALLVRQVLAAEVALLFAVGVGLAGGLLAGQSLGYAIFAVVTSSVAAGLVPATRERAGLFRAGLAVGLAGVAVVAALGLYEGRPLADLLVLAGAALVGGALLLPVAVVGLLPVVEGAFGYVTDVKLLELANLNHPALKELIVQAPGTYHHSILMGSLVEAAAQAIGANPLLARVCAYYHDLGKIRNPLFFAENQRGENRHEALAPSMSALIVKRHVTDGVELARHWRLPRVVIETIPQHHGTRLVAYFWAKAQKAAEDGTGRAVVDEALFRYNGPRPQTRENALVMIADACEASARALGEPTGDALRQLVSRRINEVFAEGQLDECELTLKDLTGIAEAITRALEAIYHTRPEYPGKDRPAPGPGLPLPPVQLVGKP